MIAYRLRSGKLILMRVVDLHTDKGGTSPAVEFLDWCGDAVPSKATIARLPVRRGVASIGHLSDREYPADRLERTGITLKPVQPSLPCGGWLWRFADERLKESFGWS